LLLLRLLQALLPLLLEGLVFVVHVAPDEVWDEGLTHQA
jgi:hypothetical protein